MSFYDPIESTFYGECVERLLSSRTLAPALTDGVVEIGTGTAVPVVDALRRSGSRVHVNGYELEPDAHRLAADVIANAGLPNYSVVRRDFFAATGAPDGPTARCAIGNPPYLPAAVRTMGAPELWGGGDGTAVARRVLSRGFDVVLLMVPSISDPAGLLAHARAEGYTVADWCVRPVPFGRYCRDPRVSGRLSQLARAGRAFFTPDSYLLGGVTWVRDAAAVPAAGCDRDVLAAVLAAAGNAIHVAGTHLTSATAGPARFKTGTTHGRGSVSPLVHPIVRATDRRPSAARREADGAGS